jgi:two-component system cell cycle sensor histidine kinase/response regulator CckA
VSGPLDLRLRAAHNLNNVLAAIIARAEAALETGRTGAAACTELEEIRRRAEEEAILVRRFLGQEGGGVEPVPVALAPLLREWAEELRHVLGPDRRLELMIANQLTVVRVDSDSLRRALRDITMNARDATNRGGLLSLRLDQRRLDHASPAVPEPVPPGEWAVIEVSDNGAGIAPDLLGRVFEPFFTTKEPEHGSGIGLASVRASVKGMGGVVTIASVLGRGTTLRLHLPPWALPSARCC